METKRTKQIEFDLKHARDANERVEAFQRPERDDRSLESEDITQTKDSLSSRVKNPSKALAALDRLQWEDRMCDSITGRRDFNLPRVELLQGELVYYKV
jgi:hypothetical protein